MLLAVVALWETVSASPDKGLLRAAPIAEETFALAAPAEEGTLIADYRHTGLTLGRPPLALLSKRLHKMRFIAVSDLVGFSDRQLAWARGLVTVRQRPATANGVLFLTIEDESGNVNVIVWPVLLEQQRKEEITTRLLVVYGRSGEPKEDVPHMVAKRFVEPTHLVGKLDPHSRNFQ